MVDRLGLALADAAQEFTEQGHRVLPECRHRRVAGLAVRIDPDGAGALLAHGHLDDQPTVAQGEREAATLVEGEVGGDVRPLVDQPVHADLGRAVLLVGDDEQEQVAAATPARASQGGERRGPCGHLVLHVDRAASPQVAVIVEDSGEGWVCPVARVGGDDVAVPDEGERRPATRSGDASEEVGPRGVACHDLDLDAIGFEIGGNEIGHRGLVTVGGVDADQVGRERDRLGSAPVVLAVGSRTRCPLGWPCGAHGCRLSRWATGWPTCSDETPCICPVAQVTPEGRLQGSARTPLT
ncbi:unannotated protein [freshwater metagenome]|uniref:Unannotated protein n=1 Tax=freshwater metagenome TaxID=449393 RepID=A0A6J7JBX9_9ZZZZ